MMELLQKKAKGEHADLLQLWKQRRAGFRREAMPYVRTMMFSGLPLVLSFLFILGAAGYVQLVQNLPPNFPVIWIGVLVLTPLVSWSPLRTWLRDADLVFLLRREADMGGYIRKSLRSGYLLTSILLLAVYGLYLPIYVQSVQSKLAASPVLLLLILLVMKLGSASISWVARSIKTSSYRRAVQTSRWLVAAVSIYLLLTLPAGEALLKSLVLVFLLLMLINRLRSKGMFPWLLLIHQEARAKRGWYRLFSMFTDVPALPARIVRRPYLTWILERIPVRQSSTFVYLYTAGLIRTEVGGILTRLIAIGGLVGLQLSIEVWLGGWPAVASAVLFVWIASAQLDTLRAAHRHSIWQHVYPLPHRSHDQQLIRVGTAFLLLAAIVLWLCASVPLLLTGHFLPPLALVLVLAVYLLAIRPKQAANRLRKEED